MIDLQKILSMSEYRKYKMNEIIAKEGDRLDHFFIVLAGSVVEVKNYHMAEPVQLRTIEQGNFFGEMDMFLERAMKSTFVADEESVVLSIEKKKFTQFAKSFPEIVVEIIQNMCKRLEGLEELEVAQSVGGYSQKVRGDLAVLFPTGHRLFEIPHDEKHDEFLTQGKYVCPNCKASFEGGKILTSKLKLKSAIKCNLRREYIDFSSSWYEVVTCPTCFYSAFDTYWTTYSNIGEATKKELKKIKQTLDFDFTQKRGLDLAFSSLYLALVCADSYRAKIQIKMKAWREINWLYEENEEFELAKMAAVQAFEAAKEYYDTVADSEEERQVILMILGTLAHKLEKYEDAVRYLGQAKFIKQGKAVYKTLIMNEYDDVKEDWERVKNSN